MLKYDKFCNTICTERNIQTWQAFKGRFYQAFSIPLNAFSGQKHKRAIIQ